MLRKSLLGFCAAAFTGFAPSALSASSATEQVTRFTTNRIVQPQIRREVRFARSEIYFDTQFDGARLNDIEEYAPMCFKALIEPENHPINDSAWYAFRARSDKTNTILLTLEYEHGPHRYRPKTSHDRIHWNLAEVLKVEGTNSSPATYKIEVGPVPLFIASQEIITSVDYESWIKDLRTNAFVRSRVIGKSARGKPLGTVEISEAPKNADLILVVGRQHPPEVTGAIALQSFVSTFCADTSEAAEFRKHFRLIVVPLINPDGVDAGHWRHNANGADLNRDWGQFNQPEPRAIRSELLRLTRGRRVRLGIDFHSTRKDVFYTSSALGLEDETGIHWLEKLQQLAPDYHVVMEGAPSAGQGRTRASAPWMRQTFRAPAITYEVGDNTDRGLIREVASKSALALMQILSEPAGAAMSENTESLK